MNDGNVVNFKPGAEVTPKRRGKFCKHAHVLAVEKSRMLECEHCGAAIDPFDFIWDWANERVRFRCHTSRLREECKKAQAQLDEIKRQERNARSRLKRVKEKING